MEWSTRWAGFAGTVVVIVLAGLLLYQLIVRLIIWRLDVRDRERRRAKFATRFLRTLHRDQK